MNKLEEQLQSKCFQWHWNNFPYERQMLFHVDNNSWNAVIGALKKALGVVAGVSDLIYILPHGKIAFLEAKIETGVQSTPQLSFEEKLKERNHYYFIFRSVEEFQDIIYTLLNNG